MINKKHTQSKRSSSKEGRARSAARQRDNSQENYSGIDIDPGLDDDWEARKRKNGAVWQKQLDERNLIEISETGKGRRLCAPYHKPEDGRRHPRSVTPGGELERWWRMHAPRTGPDSLPDFAFCAYIDVVVGLKWERIGPVKPKTGTEIYNARLSAALERRLPLPKFSTEELKAFKVPNLPCDSYIKVGETYFKPRGPSGVNGEKKPRDQHKKCQTVQFVDELCHFHKHDEAICAADMVWRDCTIERLEGDDDDGGGKVGKGKMQVKTLDGGKRWMEVAAPPEKPRRGHRILNKTVHLKNLPGKWQGKFVMCDSADCPRCKKPSEPPKGYLFFAKDTTKSTTVDWVRLPFTDLKRLKEPSDDETRGFLVHVLDNVESEKEQVYASVSEAIEIAKKMHPFLHDSTYDNEKCPDVCDAEEIHVRAPKLT
jgi:hypothetical protein